MSSRTLLKHTAAGRRQGMTLVEMLIATTITLIIMAAVAEVFGLFGAGVSDSRSVIEMTDQMRSATYRLRQDLAGATAPTLPPLDPEQEQGYFEYIEGPATDANAAAGALLDATDTTALTADCDDILLFTSRSSGGPFVGRFQAGTIESPVAEIGWFCKRASTQVAGGPTLYTLYRRQLLVLGYVGAGPFLGSNEIAWLGSWQNFYGTYDVSCRFDPSVGTLEPNTLGDLTKREWRFLHNTEVGGVPAFAFPYVANISPSTVPNPSTGETLGGPRVGEDVVLTNILSFDVRAFDPQAEVRTRASTVDAVTPGDPGFADATAVVAARGAYVDLGWNAASVATGSVPTSLFPPSPPLSAFQSGGVFVSSAPRNVPLIPATYDTWSTHYEADGVDQDDDGLNDQGTNGFDDDADGLIDEADEAETSAPYPVALRGIEVRIRCYEPSSRQIRQVTVRHTFVPH
jgi:prepilin-type N-terminal cleavage/methylation domain-containing protein